MGSGSGREGTRCSRYLPRALLTATRHILSKVLGIPEECEEKEEGKGYYSPSSEGPKPTTVDTTALTSQCLSTPLSGGGPGSYWKTCSLHLNQGICHLTATVPSAMLSALGKGCP